MRSTWSREETIAKVVGSRIYSFFITLMTSLSVVERLLPVERIGETVSERERNYINVSKRDPTRAC